MSTSADVGPYCAKKKSLQGDVAWLLHRAAHRVRVEWDAAAGSHGLRDLRDWVVLTAIDEGERRTQLAIGTELGLDKTTLTSLLDRLERDGFVVRTVDPADRRARIPELTAAGRAAQAEMVKARQEVDERLMSDFSADQRETFLTVLHGLAGVDDVDGEPLHGSCMR